jgi:valyl-tRNA synthetase
MCNPVHQEEDLTVIARYDVGYRTEEVIKWCPDCGAIVIDSETDGRVNAGNVVPMRFPRKDR